MEVDPPGVEAAPQRERELATGRHVAGEPLLGEHPVHRGARERLGGEEDIEVVMTRRQFLGERAGPGAEVVLGDDVRRGAELAGEVEHVAAADLEMTALADPRAERVHMGKLCGGARHVASIMSCRLQGWHDRSMRGLRTATEALPTEISAVEGLAYSLWLPERRPARAGVVILHGAGSCKESHHDYARVVLGAGLAAIVFDQRGHGASRRPDGRPRIR